MKRERLDISIDRYTWGFTLSCVAYDTLLSRKYIDYTITEARADFRQYCENYRQSIITEKRA